MFPLDSSRRCNRAPSYKIASDIDTNCVVSLRIKEHFETKSITFKISASSLCRISILGGSLGETIFSLPCVPFLPYPPQRIRTRICFPCFAFTLSNIFRGDLVVIAVVDGNGFTITWPSYVLEPDHVIIRWRVGRMPSIPRNAGAHCVKRPAAVVSNWRVEGQTKLVVRRASLSVWVSKVQFLFFYFLATTALSNLFAKAL